MGSSICDFFNKHLDARQTLKQKDRQQSQSLLKQNTNGGNYCTEAKTHALKLLTTINNNRITLTIVLGVLSAATWFGGKIASNHNYGGGTYMRYAGFAGGGLTFLLSLYLCCTRLSECRDDSEETPPEPSHSHSHSYTSV